MKGGTVRLSGGDLKGISVPVPANVRPTAARVREALLDSWRSRLQGAELLELFAGSGAVGLDALGRGAARLLGLEANSRVLSQLRRSYTEWSSGRAEARRATLPEDLERTAGERPFDLVFADPPYDFTSLEELLSACSAVLASEGELALEHSTRRTVPEAVRQLRLHRTRRYGDSCLSTYRLLSGHPSGEEIHAD